MHVLTTGSEKLRLVHINGLFKQLYDYIKYQVINLFISIAH
jgi:hypothetical protein